MIQEKTCACGLVPITTTVCSVAETLPSWTSCPIPHVVGLLLISHQVTSYGAASNPGITELFDTADQPLFK